MSTVKKRDVPFGREVSVFSRISPADSVPFQSGPSSHMVVPRIFSKSWDWAPVLVVDDQMINRMILWEFGLKYHIKSDEAENGKVAVQMYKDSLQNTWCQGYKLILMDLNMPVLDGLGATKKILSESPDGPKPHIIAITAFCSEEEKLKCFKYGMKGFKLKPIDLTTYQELIETTGNDLEDI